MAFPSSGLLAYWKMDETSGTRVDVQGTHDLTEVNGPISSVAGLIGNAAQLPVPEDGTVGFQTPDDSDFNPGDSDFTIAGWAYIEQDTGNLQTFFTKGRITQFKRQYFVFFDAGFGGDKFKFQVSNNGTALTTLTSSVSVSLNTFVFVVCWHDSVNDEIVIQINNTTPETLSHSGGIATTDEVVRVGREFSSSFGWPGRIDELGFWGRILTAQERTDLYNSGAGLTFSPPVTTTQTVDSDTTIDDGIEELDFIGTITPFKSSIDDTEGNVTTTQTVPVAPTLSTATDLLTGDKVRLVWTGGGPFYNVFFKKTADITFIKANQSPLPGSQTQYDVGGLERDTSYDFQVSSVNGAGVETF